MFTIIDSDADASARTISPEDERVVALATGASQGGEAAFGELYGIFSQRIFNLVLRSVRDRGTAEDLCQEIWLKVHKEIGCLRTPEAFRSWIYRIASRACIDFARSPRASRACTEELTEEIAHARETAPEDAAIRDSQVRMVWESLATIAPRQGIALYLKQVDGRSYDEIASILECSHETVESLLFRARQSFARAYQRVESSNVERCQLFNQVVAGIIDDEPTQLQKSGIKAHLQDCKPCRIQLPQVAAAAKGYALLPLLPANAVAWQVLIGGSAVGGALVAPAATGGLVAGLSLKAKLAGLISVLALGAGGAATTGVVNVPLLPDSVAVFDDRAPQSGQAALDTTGGSGAGNGEQALTDGTTPSPSTTNVGGSGSASDPSAGTVNRRDAGSPGGRGPSNPGTQPGALPPAAPTGAPDDSGDTPNPGASTPEDPIGTLLNDPLGTLDGLTGGALGDTLDTLDGTLEGLDGTIDGITDAADGALGDIGETVDGIVEPIDDLTGGVVGDTLDEFLPPGDDSGPVGDIVDGIDDTLDDLLPGEQEAGGGLLGDVLDPLLPPPSVTPPTASTPVPEATPPPQPCLLLILC